MCWQRSSDMRKYTVKTNLKRKRLVKISKVPSYTMYRPKEKLYNCIWTFHKYDEDFMPSVPHGHSGGYKLDVNDGAVYSGTSNKAIGYATKKELRRLQNNKDFQCFALEHIAWYKKTFPSVPVGNPAWLNGKVARHTFAQGKMVSNDTISFTVKIVLGKTR